MKQQKSQKVAKKYECISCDYSSVNLTDYNKHLQTRKHKITTNETNETKMKHLEIANNYQCKNCGLIVSSRTTLWRHHKKCISNNHKDTCNTDNHINDDITDKNLIMMLIKENKEIKDMMFEIMKNSSNITNNNTINNNNSHNKTFNLQVFLNETCKDAMNINEFVDSIKLQLSDFERMGEVGYAQGISEIITSNLQALDITQRPVHCTDKKRETMYVKDQDQWMKDDDNKSKIKKMIKRIENKNIQIIPQFQKKYPNYANPKSHESDKYHKTIIEVMGGPGGSEGKEGKIIRNISKVTTIREKE